MNENSDIFEVEVRLNNKKIETFWVTSKIDVEDWKQIAQSIPTVKNMLGTSKFIVETKFSIVNFITQVDLNSEINAALHKVWTKAVGTQDYNKKEWQYLETLIFKILCKIRE
jgi:hypothetical protein